MSSSTATPPERPCSVDVSVAVVNYRSLELLLDSARTWQRAAGRLHVEWCVVENGTGEPVAERLAALQPNARVTALARSVSFGAANNIALAGFRGRHVVLLNPDTLLGEGALEKLVEYLDEQPAVGIVGPRVWDDASCSSIQRSWRRFPSVMTALFSRYSMPSRLWPRNPWTRAYLNQDRSPDEIQPTDWVSGCCMAVRGQLFRALGGLDAGYPMFCEDVDFCRAAGQLGHRVVYYPRAEIVHLIGGSRRRAPLRSVWLRHRSMTRYVLKYRHHGNPLTWLLVAGVWARFALQTATARWS